MAPSSTTLGLCSGLCFVGALLLLTVPYRIMDHDAVIVNSLQRSGVSSSALRAEGSAEGSLSGGATEGKFSAIAIHPTPTSALSGFSHLFALATGGSTAATSAAAASQVAPLLLQTHQQRIANAKDGARTFAAIGVFLALWCYFRGRYDTIEAEHGLILKKNAEAERRERERRKKAERQQQQMSMQHSDLQAALAATRSDK